MPRLDIEPNPAISFLERPGARSRVRSERRADAKTSDRESHWRYEERADETGTASATISRSKPTPCPEPCSRTACLECCTRTGMNPTLIGLFMPMLPSARHYLCARCRCRVVICRHCDRGNAYCTGECAELARRESLRRAGARYRRTPRGQHHNAARQGRFRARKKEKVTHQGSLPILALVLLGLALNPRERVPEPERETTRTAIHCQVCHRECSPFLRNRFLRPSERVPPRPLT